MNERIETYLWRVLIAAAVCLSAFFTLRYWPFTLDDSFITFRYAKNMVDGYGPVFNPGSPPAEGYTSFLWVIITALPHMMGMDVEVFSKIFGVVSMYATMFICYRFVLGRMDAWGGQYGRVVAALSMLIYASYYSGASHTVSGMETATYTALLIWFLHAITVAVEKGDSRSISIAAMAGLLVGLTRPEGNLAVCVALAVALVVTRGSAGRRLVLRNAALFYALPYAIYFAWRMYYYGHFFPLTFYAKVKEPLAGLNVLLSFLNYMGARLGVLLVVGLMAYGRAMLPALLSVGSVLVFFVFPDQTIQGFNFRFLYPLVPFIGVMASIGAGVVITSFARAGERSHRGGMVTLLVLGLCIITPLVFLNGYAANQQLSIGLYKGSMSAHIPLAKRLALYEHKGERPPVLAISDAGAVPYYSGWHTIDFWSLNDEHLVFAGHDPKYVISFRPDVVVLVSRMEKEFVQHNYQGTDIYWEAMAAGMYPVRVMSFKKGSSGFFLWVMAWPGSPLWQHLTAWDGK